MFYSFYCELLIIMVHIIPVEHLFSTYQITELDHIRQVMGVLHHPTLPVMVWKSQHGNLRRRHSRVSSHPSSISAMKEVSPSPWEWPDFSAPLFGLEVDVAFLLRNDEENAVSDVGKIPKCIVAEEAEVRSLEDHFPNLWPWSKIKMAWVFISFVIKSSWYVSTGWGWWSDAWLGWPWFRCYTILPTYPANSALFSARLWNYLIQCQPIPGVRLPALPCILPFFMK